MKRLIRGLTSTRSLLCVVTIVIVLQISSCSSWTKIGFIQGTERETKRKSDVKLKLEYTQDRLYTLEPDAKILIITIKNDSASDILDCILIIDDKYEATIKNLQVNRSWRVEDFGRSILHKGEQVSFQFCHDCANFVTLYDKKSQRPLPHSTVPRTISLKTSLSTVDWNLESDN
jgi:hypothetical protein